MDLRLCTERGWGKRKGKRVGVKTIDMNRL